MSAETTEKIVREKPISEAKKELVKELVDKISSYRTVLIASCKGLPGKQFHDIKKKLRGSVEIKVSKKSIIYRAIDKIEKGAIKNLKEQIEADVVILFSNLDPFELSAILSDSQSAAKAKPGDIAPEDIEIEAGPTDLIPGPAISELGSIGLKVAVKEGKLEIMKGKIVVKKGEEIKANVASVLGKLNITPMKVGFVPLAAYDAQDDRFYVNIVVDKKRTLEALQEMIGKALGFAINVSYVTKETISYLIAKASGEEKALEKLIKEKEEKVEEKEKPMEEEVEEKPEEKKSEEGTEEKKEGKIEETDSQSNSNKQDTKEET